MSSNRSSLVDALLASVAEEAAGDGYWLGKTRDLREFFVTILASLDSCPRIEVTAKLVPNERIYTMDGTVSEQGVVHVLLVIPGHLELETFRDDLSGHNGSDTFSTCDKCFGADNFRAKLQSRITDLRLDAHGDFSGPVISHVVTRTPRHDGLSADQLLVNIILASAPVEAA